MVIIYNARFQIGLTPSEGPQAVLRQSRDAIKHALKFHHGARARIVHKPLDDLNRVRTDPHEEVRIGMVAEVIHCVAGGAMYGPGAKLADQIWRNCKLGVVEYCLASRDLQPARSRSVNPVVTCVYGEPLSRFLIHNHVRTGQSFANPSTRTFADSRSSAPSTK